MSSQELWQWVHHGYGDELGLTSSDDDYVRPPTDEDILATKLQVDLEDKVSPSDISAADKVCTLYSYNILL